jgi:hypothetical protein
MTNETNDPVVPVTEDEAVPIETLRKIRADRRAQRKRRMARALRKILLTMEQGEPATRLARLHADNAARCSCWLCRPFRVWRQLDWREQRQKVRDRDFDE